MSNVVSLGKRNKSKLEHIESIMIKSDSPTGNSKDALILFFLNCAERDGVFKEATSK